MTVQSVQPVTFVLGELTAKGAAFTFKPADRLEFEAPAGAPIEFAVDYAYAEGSTDRETFAAFLTLTRRGGVPQTTSCTIQDRPFRNDSATGRLAHPLRFEAAGSHDGRFLVEVILRTQDWARLAPPREKVFRERGIFSVKVR